MNPLRQLLRQPIKTIIGIILLSLAGAILCVSIGQYWAAAQTLAATEQDYVTVAITTDKFRRQVIEDEAGNVVGIIESDQLPFEISRYIESLPELAPELIQSVAKNGLVSGSCPELTPLLYATVYPAAKGDGGNPPMDTPYDTAILEITLTEIGEIQEISFADVQDYQIQLTGIIERTLALHEAYDDPTGRELHLNYTVSPTMTVEGLGLEVGKRYLVYGHSYSDEDWSLRCRLADYAADILGITIDPRAISWEEQLQEPTEGNADYAAVFSISNEESEQFYLHEHELSMINSSGLTIFSDPSVRANTADGKIAFWAEGGLVEMTPEEYAAMYPTPSFEEVSEDSNDSLSTLPRWNRAVEETRINNHALPVLTTGNVQAIGQFATQRARITEGRSFTAEEYDLGSPVCLISESLATANGLKLGDKITLRLYEQDPAAPLSTIFHPSNPSPDYYTTVGGFTEETPYTVVGFYRQSNEWSMENGAFTPNTVIVPDKSVHCYTRTSTDGAFSTIVLHNGAQQQLEALVTQAGYEGLFTYDDQGYVRIVDNLKAYRQVSLVVLLVGIGAWLVVLLLYLVLFPLQLKKETARMWSLGASRQTIFWQIFSRSGVIALLGALSAAGVSIAGMDWALNRLVAMAESELVFSVTPMQIIWLSVLSLVVELTLLALFGIGVSRQGKEDR